MLLREQLRAIQKELGEGEGKDAADLEELKKKLAEHPLPEEVRKEVDRELGRLERIGRESMESQVIRTFLENVAELPVGRAQRGQARRERGGAGSSTRTTTPSAT